MASPPPLETPGIRNWNGEFQDRDLEKQFRLATVAEWTRRGSLVAIVAGIFFLGGFWVDYSVLGLSRVSWMLLEVRILFGGIAIGIGWAVRRVASPARLDAIALAALLSCVAATLFIIDQTPVPATRHALTVFVFVVVFYVFVPTRVWILVFSGFLFSVVFLALVHAAGRTHQAVVIMIVIYLLTGNLLGWAVAVHLHRLRRLQWFNLNAERQARGRLLEEVFERKQAEESLRHLASGVAHNFNNALMAISSNIQAAQGALNGKGDEALAQSLLDNAWRSAATGREVAQRLSRAVVGETRSRQSAGLVELGELIAQAKSIAWLTWARPDQKIAFSQEIEPGLWVIASQGEIMEVFQNIFKNSLEALGSNGHIAVRARRRDRRIRIEVQDDGPGIAPEVLGRLFRPFASDKGVRGQGLGLAVSKGIITGLGGDITCRSQPGLGTTMRIELPAAGPPPAPTPAPSPDAEQPPGRGRRVLLVEDEGLVALGVSAFLRQEGYQVWQARDAAEAGAMLSQAEPHLVVSDFGLPDGNARDVQRAARHWAEQSASPEPALIVLSGWSEALLRDREAAPSFEPFAWLQKPVEKRELVDVLRRAAEGTPTTSPGGAK